MTISILDIMEMAESHAAASGWFERVNKHEPKNAPGYGLSAAIWIQSMKSVPARSGLSSTSSLIVMTVRAYSNMLQEPQDMIDINLLRAVDDLFGRYSGDFTLDGLVSHVDLLGESGVALSAEAGYLEIDKKIYRVMDITLPCIINDAWTQAP